MTVAKIGKTVVAWLLVAASSASAQRARSAKPASSSSAAKPTIVAQLIEQAANATAK